MFFHILFKNYLYFLPYNKNSVVLSQEVEHARSGMKKPGNWSKIYPGDGGLVTFAIRDRSYFPGSALSKIPIGIFNTASYAGRKKDI